MDSYVDYDFYSETFGGDTIPQETFEKYAKGASYEVRLRIHNKDISDYEDTVKECACSVAEILYNQYLKKEKINNIIDGSEIIVTSEKVGDYSRNISSVTLGELVTLSSDDKVSQEIDKVVTKQLLFTNLLYGGINVH